VIVVATLAAGVAACTDDGDSASPSATTQGTTVAPATGSPNSISDVVIPPERIPDAVDQLDTIVTDALAATGIPGAAVAVIHEGEVIYAEGFGVREVGTDQPVDPDTRFQLASLSKPIGATVVAAEVGQGTVAWEDPVSAYTPDFVLSDPYVTETVTIADLYSHRSGIPAYSGDLLEDMGYDRAAVLEKMRLLPLEPFRITYGYTNFGITAGAEAVAAAAGVPWEQLSAAELYEPLGMDATTSVYEDFLAADNRATLHKEVDGTWTASERDPTAQDPAGGVTSTVNDLAKWMDLQLSAGEVDGRQLVDANALLQMQVPAISTQEPADAATRAGFYGHGMNVSYDGAGRVRLSHSGAFFLGAGTNFVLYPSEDLGIVVLTNGQPIGVAEGITATFMDLVTLGQVSRDWFEAYGQLLGGLLENPSELAGQQPPANAAPPRAAAAYVGTYANEYFGPAEVAEVNGALVLRLGPDALEFPLEAWDGDVFAFTPPGENSLGITKITFTVDSEGTATGFESEYYDPTGFGTWTR
jgi:CubicO group peptidase (beta-lactamase class C family)